MSPRGDPHIIHSLSIQTNSHLYHGHMTWTTGHVFSSRTAWAKEDDWNLKAADLRTGESYA